MSTQIDAFYNRDNRVWIEFKSSLLLRILGVIAIIVLSIGAYLYFIRPVYMNWGATDEEILRMMPGNELVSNPTFNATRAVTIRGTPEEIWPWLVQIGYGRAGFYGYDLIENLGSPRGIRSAESIIPELQQLAVGDEMPISVIATYMIYSMDANRSMVWVDEDDGAFTWGLYPIDENHTRLVLRFRFRHRWIDWLFTDWADHVAVSEMLLGIKDRVEGRAKPFAEQNAEIGLWAVSFVGFVFAVFLIFAREKFYRAWFLALVAAAVLLILLYLQPPLLIGAVLVVGLWIGLIWVFRLWQASKRSKSGITISS